MLATLASLLALGGCDKGDDPIVVPETTVELGPEGGEVVAEDASITIPAGALDDAVEITIGTASGSTAIDGYDRVGLVIEILPSGTTFNTPATVRIPFNPSQLPPETDVSSVVVATADSLDDELTLLATTVDSGSSSATVEVSHLSVFAPFVAVPTPSSFPPCPGHGECDCSIRDEFPLNVTGRADLGRLIHGMCVVQAGENLIVTSYVDAEDIFVEPTEIYTTELDPETLAVISEEAVPGPLSSSDLCQPVEESFLSGQLEGATFWVEFVDHEDPVTEDRWKEALLYISSETGGVVYSFNRHLNSAPPYRDSYAFYDDSNTLVGRLRADGAAAFYLHNYSEAHIDIIIVRGLSATLSDPELDEFGHGIPPVRSRFELADDPEQRSGSSASHPTIHLEALGETSDHLTVIGSIRGFHVDSEGAFTELPELVIDSDWTLAGWQNGGEMGGHLVIQSGMASFSNSFLFHLDPVSWSVVNKWQIGCIGPPMLDGFQVLRSKGLVMRRSYAEFGGDVDRLMFFRGGEVLAIGEVPPSSPFAYELVAPDQSAVYVAQVGAGTIMAVAVPE